MSSMSFTQSLLDGLGATKDVLFPFVSAANPGFGPVGNGISAVHGAVDMHAKGKDIDDAIAHQAGKFGASLVPMGPGAEGIDAGATVLDGLAKAFFPDSDLAENAKVTDATKLIKDVLPTSVFQDAIGEMSEAQWNLMNGDFDDMADQWANLKEGKGNAVFQGLAGLAELQTEFLMGDLDAVEETIMTMGGGEGDTSLLAQAGAAMGDDVVECVEDPSAENLAETALKYSVPGGSLFFD